MFLNAVGLEVDFTDTAASTSRCTAFGLVEEVLAQCLICLSTVVHRLREFIYCLVVAWVVSLFFSSNVLNTLSPGVNRIAPIAAALNGDVVYASDDAEKALFSPMRPPAIFKAPERYSVLFAITYKFNFVCCIDITCLIIINTTCVVI